MGFTSNSLCEALGTDQGTPRRPESRAYWVPPGRRREERREVCEERTSPIGTSNCQSPSCKLYPLYI